MAKKILNYLYVILFLCIMVIPLILMNTKKYSISEIDNRLLAPAPQFGEEDFPAKFETYLKDRIGFRSEMINSYNVLNDVVFDELTHPLYAYGKDDQVFFEMNPVIEYSDYHKAFAEYVKQMQDYCEAHGIDFYFAFEPEKLSVLRDQLPEGVNYIDEWADEMLAYMKELGVHVIDNKSLLIEKNRTEQVFNVQFDAGHWNDLGCFYATNNVLRRINQDHPEVTELSKSDFTITTKVAQYLPVSQFEVNETVPSFALRSGWTTVSSEYSEGMKINPSYHYFHYFINDAENAEELPRLLRFQGSYYNTRPQFFVSRFSEDIAVHNYQNVFDLDYYCNAFDPDIVLFEVTEYTFKEGYFSSGKMADPGWNPPIVDQRKDASVEDQLKEYLSSAIPMPDRDLFVLRYDKLEKVYLYDEDLRTAKYLYLLADGRIIDIKKDSDGYYSALVPSDMDLSEARLLIETIDGDRLLYLLSERKSCFLQDSIFESSANYWKLPDGQIYKDELGTLTEGCEMTSDVEGNVFNRFLIRLFDITGTTVIDTLHEASSPEEYHSTFTSQLPTGWYRLRIQANSNKHDEYIDYFVFIESGEFYTLSFKLNKITSRQIVYSEFNMYGPSEYKTCNRDLIDSLTPSEGATVKPDTSINIATDLTDNRFTQFAIVAISDEVEGDVHILSGAAKPGKYEGYYAHTGPSGSYTVYAKGNSNIKDEYVTFPCKLKKHALYEYSYEIVEKDDQHIVIKDLSLKQISE